MVEKGVGWEGGVGGWEGGWVEGWAARGGYSLC